MKQLRSILCLILPSSYSYSDYTPLGGEDYMHIDFCHVSPNGHEIIADHIMNYMDLCIKKLK